MTGTKRTKQPQDPDRAGIDALYKLLKNHPKYCKYWNFGGDRYCTCGRDIALETVQSLLARAGVIYNHR